MRERCKIRKFRVSYIKGSVDVRNFQQKHDKKGTKDTHRKKAPSNETLAFTESMIMNIWVVVTSNQLFKRGF